MQWYILTSYTLEAEAEGPPQAQGQSGRHSEFYASQSYVGRPCLKNNNTKTRPSPNDNQM